MSVAKHTQYGDDQRHICCVHYLVTQHPLALQCVDHIIITFVVTTPYSVEHNAPGCVWRYREHHPANGVKPLCIPVCREPKSS